MSTSCRCPGVPSKSQVEGPEGGTGQDQGGQMILDTDSASHVTDQGAWRQQDHLVSPRGEELQQPPHQEG